MFEVSETNLILNVQGCLYQRRTYTFFSSVIISNFQLNMTTTSTEETELGKFEKFYKEYIETTKELLENDVRTNKRVFFLLGTTGTGKTSLAKFLTCDQSLTSIQKGGEYVIVDDNNEIGNSYESSTSKPKMYQYAGKFYTDCPGYGDNRGPESDMSGAYLMRKIVERDHAVKLVIVVKHPTVRSGVNDKVGILSVIKQVFFLLI